MTAPRPAWIGQSLRGAQRTLIRNMVLAFIATAGLIWLFSSVAHGAPRIIVCNDRGCSDRQSAAPAPNRAPARGKTFKMPVDANGNLATLRSASGKTAKVAARYRSAFQGLIDDLEAAGYRIEFMGGWRKWGSCRRCDSHPAGRAVDINQTARNRVTRRFPADVTKIAARHGICHGAIWGSPDRGHFEVADASRSTQCRAMAERQGWPRVVGQSVTEVATP